MARRRRDRFPRRHGTQRDVHGNERTIFATTVEIAQGAHGAGCGLAMKRRPQLRVMRANLLDELNKPYVVTARAKGLSEWRLVLRYPARLALNPLVSTIGWYLPALFSGSLIVATVMNIPNIGPLLLRALINQDMYLAGSILLIYCFLAIVGTLVSDILLAWIDPRIRVDD